MRRPGMEFGSEKPDVIYVALRWNDPKPTIDQEENMVRVIAQKLNSQPSNLRIYNLVRPSKDRGMSLNLDELADVEETIKHIQSLVNKSHKVRRIVVGGKSGPMPLVALLLKLLIPKIRIEIRNHHKARPVNAPALAIAKVIQK